MYEYNIEVLRIIDGDTVDVRIDLGFNVWVKNRLRLYGIDTPEVRTRDLDEKAAGIAAKEALEEMISEAQIAGNQLKITSHGLDKYGRSLATIYIDTLNVNKWLLTEGYATEYIL